MLIGVGFGTSSAEATEAVGLELMGKLEAPRLTTRKPLPRSDGVWRSRWGVQRLPRRAKSLTFRHTRDGDDLSPVCRWETRSVLCSSCARRRVHRACDCSVRSTTRCGSFLVARRVHCGLRVILNWERCCTVRLVRDTWVAAGMHTSFPVCGRRVLCAEHQIWAILVSSCSTQTPVQWRSSRTGGSSSIARIVLFSFSDRCASREFANLESSCAFAHALQFVTPGSMRDNLRHGATLPVAWILCRVRSALSRSVDGRISRFS